MIDYVPILAASVEGSLICKEREYMQDPEHENKKFALFQRPYI